MVYRLAIVGGGNMGAALVGGLLQAEWPTSELAIVEPSDSRRQQLREMFPGIEVTTTTPPCEAAVIAVKPADVAGACAAAVAAGARRLLSIAAGIKLVALEIAAGPNVAIVRAMPNTPALVGQGAAAISAGTNADEPTMAWAEAILSSVGIVVRVAEDDLDAVTGLSGSGPAYLFLIAEALIEAGVASGLGRATSEDLVTQLLVGSAALLRERGDPAALREMVTSPGGTTAAGLGVLDANDVRRVFVQAVLAAKARSIELGNS